MGGGSSAEESFPPAFRSLYENDLKMNDPSFQSILSTQPLDHQILNNPLLIEIINRKPNNIKTLVYHMVFAINRASKVPQQSDLPRSLLINCLNSYLLLQHLHSFCIDSWFCWQPPNNSTQNLPSLFFTSSFILLNHPQIFSSAQKNSIFYHIKYEMIASIILFLLSTPQPICDHLPNLHFDCLDEVDPTPLFRLLLSYKEFDELIRTTLIVVANGVAFCPNWQAMLDSINITDVCYIFMPLLTQPIDSYLQLVDSTNPGIFHELIALFYQLLLVHSEACSVLPHGRRFLLSLLLPLQLFNEKLTLCYFHSLVLSSLVLLTSDSHIASSLNEPFTDNFPCKQSVHRGTYADLLLEVVINSAGTDLSKTSPLLPAIACIFHNISAHVKNFSFFTCNQIFKFLQALMESRDRQAPKLVQIIIDGFNQILAEQFDHNITILMFIMRNMRLFKALRQKGINVQIITVFAKCFKQQARKLNFGKMGTDEAEIVLKKLKPSMFLGDFEPPGPRGHIFTGEMAELWPDWMRTLAMRAGSFKTLQMISAQ